MEEQKPIKKLEEQEIKKGKSESGSIKGNRATQKILKEKQEERKKDTLKYLREGLGIVTYACSRVGISKTLYYKWLKRDAKFKRKVEKIQKMQRHEVEDRLLKHIDSGNIAAVIFYLKCKHPDYKPISKLEGDLGVYNPYDKLTVEQLKKRVRGLVKDLGEKDGKDISKLGK